jgi:hypothetical protein
MTLIELVKKAQSAIGLTPDGSWGPVSQSKSNGFDVDVIATEKQVAVEPEPAAGEHAENPAFKKAHEYDGQSESKPKFVAWLSGFWPKVGLSNYKTIIGASFAWCGLFVAAMNSETGLKIVSGAAGAKNWAKYGVAIEWKTNGIPRGAVMHLDHDGDCVGGSNHVTFADGDCTVEDLAKLKQVPGFGGNQGNTVKRSMYPTYEICEVRWPSEIPKPGKIEKSVDCAGKGSSGESTR